MTTREAMRIEQWAERMATEALLVGVDCAPCAPMSAERCGWWSHRAQWCADPMREWRIAPEREWAVLAGWLAREIYLDRKETRP